MHELDRLAYLEALGTQSYVSRGQLRGAAPSHRLAIVRVPVSASPAIPRIDLEVDLAPAAPPTRRPPAPTTAKPEIVPQPAPRFSLAVIIAEGWLWLEELGEGVLAREQVQLVQAMGRALARIEGGAKVGAREATDGRAPSERAHPGGDSGRPEITQFNWPIHTNRQLDIGPDAARSSLAGFIQRKLDERACRGLVVLGEDCAARVPLDQLSDRRLCCTASTTSMLQDPQLKRRVWSELQTLAAQ